MPLKGAVILSGCTGMTPVGGASRTLSSDGVAVNGGVHLIDAAVTDYRVRPTAIFKYRPPVYNAATKTWSKDRKSFQFVIPEILADGSITYNLVRGEREMHPESLNAKALELNYSASQMFTDADMVNFWGTGTTD